MNNYEYLFTKKLFSFSPFSEISVNLHQEAHMRGWRQVHEHKVPNIGRLRDEVAT